MVNIHHSRVAVRLPGQQGHLLGLRVLLQLGREPFLDLLQQLPLLLQQQAL